LIANPQACAESISLHKVCHHAIYLDKSYNCGQFIQSKDRIHRIDVESPISPTYYYLYSVNDMSQKLCIDEIIHKKLLEKEETMLRILEDENYLRGSNQPEDEEKENEELYHLV
jgi:hypothetical protein